MRQQRGHHRDFRRLRQGRCRRLHRPLPRCAVRGILRMRQPRPSRLPRHGDRGRLHRRLGRILQQQRRRPEDSKLRQLHERLGDDLRRRTRWHHIIELRMGERQDAVPQLRQLRRRILHVDHQRRNRGDRQLRHRERRDRGVRQLLDDVGPALLEKFQDARRNREPERGHRRPDRARRAQRRGRGQHQLPRVGHRANHASRARLQRRRAPDRRTCLPHRDLQEL